MILYCDSGSRRDGYCGYPTSSGPSVVPGLTEAGEGREAGEMIRPTPYQSLLAY